MPDRTFVLDLDPATAAGRLGGERDRIEREDDGFRAAVAAGYRRLGDLFPERVRMLDASLPAPEIAQRVRAELDV